MKFHDHHEQEDEKITLSKTITNIGNLEGVQKKVHKRFTSYHKND